MTSDPTSNLQSPCEVCGKPATQWVLRDPSGKSDAKRPVCGEHGLRIRDPADVAEIARLKQELWVIATAIWENVSRDEVKHWAQGIRVSISGASAEPPKFAVETKAPFQWKDGLPYINGVLASYDQIVPALRSDIGPLKWLRSLGWEYCVESDSIVKLPEETSDSDPTPPHLLKQGYRSGKSEEKSSEQECRRAGLSDHAAGTGTGDPDAEARSSRREVTAQKASAPLDRKVTVCAACLCACCWQGEFYCDQAKTAGTVEKTVRELLQGNLREDSGYWFKDVNTGEVDYDAKSAAKRAWLAESEKVNG